MSRLLARRAPLDQGVMRVHPTSPGASVNSKGILMSDPLPTQILPRKQANRNLCLIQPTAVLLAKPFPTPHRLLPSVHASDFWSYQRYHSICTKSAVNRKENPSSHYLQDRFQVKWAGAAWHILLYLSLFGHS